MRKKKRVTFTFDERSFVALEEMTEGGHFPPMGRKEQKFHEIVVRHQDTGEERMIIIPVLNSLEEEVE